MTRQNQSPPPARWLVRIVETCLPTADREYVVGDLLDAFASRAHEAGRFHAYLSFGVDALSSVAALVTTRSTPRDAGAFHQPENPMLGLRTDILHAARFLRRAPGFAAICTLTLGLGIGAASTMFGVVERIVLRGPDHVADPAHVVRAYALIKHKGNGLETSSITPYAMYTAIRDHGHSFTRVAAYQTSSWIVGTGIDARSLPGVAASADFFPLVGVRPYLGRFYTSAEDAPNASSDVAVLSYEYWQRALGADSSILGRRMSIAFRPFTVIGIAPPRFTGVELQPVDYWIPLSSGAHPRPDWPTTWQARWLQVVARLKPGVSREQASKDASLAFRRSYNGASLEWAAATVSLRPISYTSEGTESPVAPIARWLMGVAFIVLIIACANVGNLLVSRVLRRRNELAVRVALGMGRSRLAALLVSEGLIVALAGGLLGVGVAYGGGQLIRRFFLENVAWAGSPVNGRILLMALLLTMLVALLVSLAPLAQLRLSRLASALRSGRRDGGGQAARTRTGLLLIQVSLTTVLLIGAGLFVRSLANVRSIDLGIQTDKVLIASVYWPAAGTVDPAVVRRQRDDALRRIRDTVSRLPGFEAASLVIGSPFRSAMSVDVRVPGRDSLPKLGGGGPYVIAVGPDYFRTVGTRIDRGRAFMAYEGAMTARTAIVNETMARALWPGQNPLGQCVYIGDEQHECSTVVGVVPEVHRFGIREDPAMQTYIPLGQESGISGTGIVARPASSSKNATEVLRRTIASMVPGARYVDVASLQDQVDPQIRPWRLGAAMFGLFGVLALIVATTGLYSVIAYAVTQRTHEFGVRIALGASTENILGLVLGNGLRIAAIGSAIAVLVAILMSTRLEAQLFDESSRDPVVYGLVIVTILIVSLGATLAPAFRAATLNPTTTLRED